jgi:carbonic anhydrase
MSSSCTAMSSIAALISSNVVAQVANVCHASIVQEAWRGGRPLAVHGWIYSVSNGLLQDLDITVEHAAQIPNRYQLP